jgi:preprotein translocase subunit SecG
MITVILTVLHVIACLILILVILLQAGRGGGLSEMFGGALQQNQKLFGTETNVFLTRATTYSAVVFLLTSVLLGVVTTQRGKSVMTEDRVKSLLKDLGTVPAAPPGGTASPEAPAAPVPPGGVAGAPAPAAAPEAAAPVPSAEGSVSDASATPPEAAPAT